MIWLAESLGSGNHLLDHFKEVIAGNRFHQPARGAQLLGLVALCCLGLGGQGENGSKAAGGQTAGVLDQVHPAHVRHVDVGDNQIKLGACL